MKIVKSMRTSIAVVTMCLVPLVAQAQIVTATITNPAHAAAELNAATQNLANVSVLVIPRGQYHLDSSWLITSVGSGDGSQAVTHDIKIMGYGAELFTPATLPAGNFPAIKIQFANNPYTLTLEGFTINHLDNTAAPSALEVVQSANLHLTDITVEANNSAAAYAAFYLHSLNASADTGTFWTIIDRCTVGKRSSNYAGMAAAAIRLEGAVNATTIQNSSFSNVYTAVEIKAFPGGSYLSNGVLIQGNWIEGFSQAIKVIAAQDAGGTWRTASGLRILNNRLEASGIPWDTVFFRYAGAGGNEADPPVLAFNYLVGVHYYLENDAGRKVVIMDAPTMPAVTSVHVSGR